MTTPAVTVRRESDDAHDDSPLASIRCPGCTNKVLQKSADGTFALRPKGSVRFVDGACRLDCHYCGRAVELPVTLAKSNTPRRDDAPSPQLTLPARER